MAAGNSKEIAQASVRLYPIIEGLSKMIGEQLKDSKAEVAGKSKEMGRRIAESINSGLDRLNASGVTEALSKGFSGVFRDFSASAMNVFKNVGSTAIRTLGGSFKHIASSMSSTLMNAAKTTAGVAGGIIATGLGFSITKGFSRALTTTEARAKMKGLGYEGQNLSKIMQSASDAVDGLAFSTGDAATAASGLLASGVKPGEDLTRVLRSIGDTASLTGREFSDISSIYGKVFASGIIQGEELNQLMDSGVPILQYLSKSMGIATADVKKMASQGKVSSADFAKAMEENLGGVGERMASASFSLSARNVASQAGRIFEPLFTTALESAIPVLGKIRTKLKEFVAFLAPVLKPIQENIISAFQNAERGVERFNIGSVFTRISTTVSRFKDVLLPVAGLVLGLSGSLLQSIPIIGGLFSGVTGPIGLLAGFLTAVFINSEKLRNSFGGLTDSVGKLLSKIFNVQMGDYDIGSIFKSIGDGLANGIDSLSASIDEKAGNLASVVNKVWSGIINPKTIDTLKEGGGKIFAAIGEIFSSIFSVIVEVITDPRVRLAGAQIVESFGHIFEAFAQVAQKDNISSIASVISSAIAITASLLANAVIVIADVIKEVVKVTSTPAFSAFAGWLKTSAQVIVQSSGFLKAAFIGIVAAFLAFKFAKVLGTVFLITGVFKKISGLFSAGADVKGSGEFGKKIAGMVKGLGKGIAAAFRSIPAIAQAFVAAAPHLLAAIGIAGLILLALGTLGHILKALKVGEGLAKLGEVLGSFVGIIMTILEVLVTGMVKILTTNAPIVAAAMGAIFVSLGPILNFVVALLTLIVNSIVTILRDVLLPFLISFVQNLGNIFNGIANVLVSIGEAIFLILTGIAIILETVFTGIAAVLTTFATSVVSVVTALTNGGFEAAAAAMALAAGITALSLAMAGGTLLNAGANFGAGILNMGKNFSDSLSGLKGGKLSVEEPTSAMGQILQLVAALQSASDIISVLKTNWTLIAEEALMRGASIISNLSLGMMQNQFMLNEALSGAINNMLATAQGQLDTNPLKVRVNMPNELSAGGVASMNYSGQTSNTQNNAFNITNPNPFVVANAINNMMK